MFCVRPSFVGLVFSLCAFLDSDVEFLRSVLPPATDPAFFQYLRDLDCSGVTLCSVPEGTVVFARVSCRVRRRCRHVNSSEGVTAAACLYHL